MYLCRVLINSLIALATLGAFVSLGSFFSKYHILFDLISHFRVQYIVMLLPAFLVAIVAKKTLPVLVISFALAVHGYVVTMSMLPVSPDNNTEYAELTVLSSNLLLVNTDYQAQSDIIVAKDPDVIAFQEYTFEWHRVLSRKLTSYPHSIISPAYGSFGIALYSKHPITDGAVDVFSTDSFPAINADIQVGESNVRVMAVHPPPPGQTNMYLNRNQYMQRIALESEAQDGAVLVMGDFNATPWTSHFTDMLAKGRLRNASAGFGFNPTWPSPIFALSIPIDHILINARISVDHFESIHLQGSDHRNVLGRLRVY